MLEPKRLIKTYKGPQTTIPVSLSLVYLKENKKTHSFLIILGIHVPKGRELD